MEKNRLGAWPLLLPALALTLCVSGCSSLPGLTWQNGNASGEPGTTTPSFVPVTDTTVIPNNATRFEMADLVAGDFSYGTDRATLEAALGAPQMEDNVVWDANGEAHDTLYYEDVSYEFVRAEDADKASATLCGVTVTSTEMVGPRGIMVGANGQMVPDAFYIAAETVMDGSVTMLYFDKILKVPMNDGTSFDVYLAPSGQCWTEEGDTVYQYRVPEYPYASAEEEEGYSYVSHGNLYVTIGADGLVQSYAWWVGADAE